MTEFRKWKELEEESTYTTYVQHTGATHPALSESIKLLKAL